MAILATFDVNKAILANPDGLGLLQINQGIQTFEFDMSHGIYRPLSKFVFLRWPLLELKLAILAT